MATKFSVEEWDQLSADLDKINDFSKEDADTWLRRHGYGPSLRAEALEKLEAGGPFASAVVEVPKELTTEVEVRKWLSKRGYSGGVLEAALADNGFTSDEAKAAASVAEIRAELAEEVRAEVRAEVEEELRAEVEDNDDSDDDSDDSKKNSWF